MPLAGKAVFLVLAATLINIEYCSNMNSMMKIVSLSKAYLSRSVNSNRTRRKAKRVRSERNRLPRVVLMHSSPNSARERPCFLRQAVTVNNLKCDPMKSPEAYQTRTH